MGCSSLPIVLMGMRACALVCCASKLMDLPMSMFWRLEQHALLVKAGADLPVDILDPSHGQHAVLVVLEEHTHSSCCWFMPCVCAVRSQRTQPCARSCAAAQRTCPSRTRRPRPPSARS